MCDSLDGALDELRLAASMIRRFGPRVTEKQAEDIARRIDQAVAAVEQQQHSPGSRGTRLFDLKTEPSPRDASPSSVTAATDVSRRPSHANGDAPHLASAQPQPLQQWLPALPSAPRPPTVRGGGHPNSARTGTRGTQRNAAPAQSPASARELLHEHAHSSPAGSAVVKVTARTLLPVDNTAASAAQQRAKEMQLAVGAAVLLVVEGTLAHLQAEGGAVYVSIADEMVSIATLMPGLPTYPPPLLKHLIAGSVTGAVLSSGVALHQAGPGLDDNNRRVPSQLLLPIISRDGRRVGVLQIIGKFRGAGTFSEADEQYASAVAELLAGIMTRYPIVWAGPAYDPVALHKASPFTAATISPGIYDTIPLHMRQHRQAPLIHRTGGTLSLAKRLALADDAAALGSAPTLREVDCYVDNLQECWRKSVQLNIEHGQQEQERLTQLRTMREELRAAKAEARTMSDKLRLEHLDVADYRAEYTTLKEELDRFLARKRAFDE
jgi:hypothetical protein